MYPATFQPEVSLRIHRIQQLLQRIEADALLLNTNVSLYYSSGRVFNGYTYIPVEGEAHYFVRRPIGLQGDRIHYINKPEQIPAILTETGIVHPHRIALEWDAPHSDYARLANLFPEAEAVNGSIIMRQTRSVKTDYEIEQLRIAAQLHDHVYCLIPSLYRPGMRDIELQIEIERELRLHGCLGQFRINGQSMELFMGNLICGDNADTPSPYDFAMGGAGMNQSIPVGCNGSIIAPGMSIMVDMNGNFNGYMTDMTRVFAVGKLPELAYHAHQCSAEIHQAVAAAGRPGVPASHLYEIAVEMAQQAGLADYFMGHRQKAGFVGHGVSIEVNEAPVLAPRSKDILESNQVIALEPKFVIPHVGAVGFEDTYLVTPDGLQSFNDAPREIIVME